MTAGGPRYAAVALPVPVRRPFWYLVGSRPVVVGSRVQVPLGRRAVPGTVVELSEDPPEGAFELKPIAATLDTPPLTSRLLELTRFVADYYLCAWGEAIEAALPPRTRLPVVPAVRPGPAGAEGLSARAVVKRRVLERVVAARGPVPLRELDAGEKRAARELCREDRLERTEVEAEPAPVEAPGPPDAAPVPTEGQARVLATLGPALAGDAFAPFLLYGETGSGKTEVYFRAAEAVLARGRSVLYLVPEIGLTPLLVAKIRRRFPAGVAVLHSGMPSAARARAWRDVREGRARLAVGARSAIFAPLPDCGLIVVDEEQDGSYKQEERPRYNARDLAVVRARAEDAVLLLGSATPSVESFHQAERERYRLLRLGARVSGRPLPEVALVDMREEFRRRRQVSPVSEGLAEALRACVERGEQALVLRNRRGWSQSLLCLRCGVRLGCGSCSVALTWHRAEARFRCHYCGTEERMPPACPTCGAEDLRLLGEGTEQIEDILREHVPGARIERMDRDTTRRRGAQAAILDRFDRGETDVLVGTQMIAKGHDFPRVTLVGVLAADHALGLPDYRAGERVFQLLTQVAGRAGRGERPGRVVLQAFQVDHPLLAQAAAQDYEAFYAREIRYRSALRYPPVSAMVQLVIQDRDPGRTREWAELLAGALREIGGAHLMVSGPGPAPIERIKGLWRRQILVRTAGRRRLISIVEQALERTEGTVPRKGITVDVDPYSLL